MADNIESRIDLNIDVSSALSSIRTLQAQISAFHQSIRNSGNSVNQAVSDQLTKNLLNSINATKQFSASLTTVKDSAQTFTTALEKNKLSLGQYFKFGAASTKTFGRLFRSEFDTIEKVARERVKTLQTQYIRMGRDANGALEAIRVRPLRLDMEQLGTQVSMTAQKQQLFNQLLKQGSTNLLNFGKNTQWAGRQLMVGFTIPLSIMGSMAIKEFEKIEKQAIRFRRVYGDAFSTDAETKQALQNMRELATEFTKYGIEVNKTLELAADVAQMGLVGADLRAQVTEATRLAVLGEVEQQEALQATISVTNAFGVAAEDLAKKIDFLNAVENQTVTSISDLTIAIPKAGPVVQQLGGSVEDLAFFLTAMREGGINASEGANALKSGLSKIINPTKVSTEMLAGFGINLKGIVEANKGDIKGTILTLAEAFDTLDPLNRARAIEQLFGTFQFARLSTLFQNVTKEGGQAQRILELTNASAQQLAILSERELKKVEESPLFKLQKAIERLQEALAPLGEEFIKIITPLIQFGTDVLKKFNEMDSGAKAFVTNVVTVLGLIAPVAIMTFGLLANGIANFIKGINFVRGLFGKLAGAGTGLNQMTQYMTQEQLEATAAASALGQAHSQLTTVFTAERNALSGLTTAYNNAIIAINRYNAASSQTRARPGSQTKNYASGVLSVPGPKGAGDIIPAMLSPGEAVIPAEEAAKYRGIISAIISDSVPGFSKGVFLGLPKSAKSMVKHKEAASEIYQKFLSSKYANVPPTEYGHQLAKTSGHSFPIFGLGGVYTNPAGKKVFVKPVIDEAAALAEIRGTQITRQAHGLKAPQQRIVVIRDPYDVKRQRRFLALESDLDPTFMNTDEKAVFNEEQYFRQLVASLVRVDKDLSASNVYGDVVADVGPAGVFTRASGQRALTSNLPSMEEQAMINLLGVRGGAKRAFAESTLGLMGNLTPQQYHQKMIQEIRRVVPLLRQTVASFGLTDPTEVDAYNGMIKRLEEGLGVNWAKYHAIHSAVKPGKPRPNQKIPKFAKGVFNLGGPRGAGDIIPAMIAPGESVISADMTQKYGPLIQGIIADNLPGFQNSLVGNFTMPPVYAADVGDAQRRRASISQNYQNVVAAGFEQEAQAVISELRDFGASVAQAQKMMSYLNQATQKGPEAVKSWMDQLRISAQEAKTGGQLISSIKQKTGIGVSDVTKNFAHIGGGAEYIDSSGQKRVVKSEFGMSDFDAKVNAQLAKKGGAAAEDFFEAYDTAGIEKWNHSIQKGGGDLEELSADIQLFDARLKEIIQTSGAARVFDLQADADAYGPGAVSIQGATSQVMKEMEGSKLVDALSTSATVPREIREKGAGRSLPKGFNKEEASLELLKAGKSEGIIADPLDAGISDAQQYEQGISNVLSDGQSDPFIVSTPLRNSPHPDAGPSGKADAEAYRINFNAGMGSTNLPPAMPPTTKQSMSPGSPMLPSDIAAKMGMSASVGGRPEADKKTSALGKIKDVIGQKAKTVISKGIEGIENKLEESLTSGLLGKTALGQAMIDNAMSDAIEKSGSGGVVLTNSKGEVLDSYDGNAAVNKILNKKEELLDREEGLTQSQDYLLQENGQQLNQTGDQQLTRKELIAQERADKADQKRLQKQAAAQRRQGRAGRALGALGTATMVAGMASGVEGPVGEIARGVMPALAGLSAIAPILLALPAPLALLAAGVGLAAFAFMEWNKMMQQAREEGTALANALTMTTDKLIKLSEATGKVSATEERRRKEEDQLSGEDAKSRKFGMTFLESEAGQQFLSDISTVTKSGLGKEESAEAAGRQLAIMMAQGLISSGEAASIASAIGGEINDYNFAAKVAGEIIELTGPNGEDLTKDPLRVALAIQQGSMEDLQQISELALDPEKMSKNVEKRLSKQRVEAQQQRDIKIARGGFEGFGAQIESAIVGFFSESRATNPIDWLFEDVTKNVGNISETDPEFLIEKAKENEKLQAASVQLGINQVQQNQQILDSTEKQFEQKIKQKEQEIAATTSVEKKKKLEQELNEIYKNRDTAVKDINKANAESLNQIVQMKKDYDPAVFGDAIKTSVLAAYSEDNPMRAFAEDAVDRLNALKDSEFKTQIQLQFASGELSVDAVNALLETQKLYPVITGRFNAIVAKRGTAAGGQLLDLMVKAGLSPKGIDSMVNTFMKIETEEEFDNATEALAQIANMEKEYGFKVNLESGANKDTLSDVTKMVEMTKDMPKKVTREQAIQFQSDYIAKGGKANPNFQAVIDNWDKIFGEGMVGSAEVFVEFTATGDYDSVNRYLTGSKAEGGLGLDAKGVSLYFQSMEMNPAFKKKIQDAAATYDVALGNKNKPDPGDKIDEEQTGGGAGKENPLDALLRRLKLVRDASINASGGIKILRDAMRNGTKATTKFLGIEQKLLQQGVSKRFIDELMSMDEEFRKQYLAGEKSGVVKLTKDGERLSQLLNELTLGDYNISISANVQEVNAQVSAMTKLTAAGMSLSDSSEVVQDRQLALAIAHATTKEEVKLLVDGYKELKKAEQAFLLATPEGRQREFQSIYSEANAFFAAEEERQNLRYEAAVKAYEVENDIVDAQRRSADIEFELDDLQYALDQIAEQEAKINEEYDKREEAIENIFKANKAIIDQDKEKLDIAGALASGDLAAAAKAMRAQTTANLERNKENQLENLRKSRELDLAQVRDKQGKSRIELETQIRDLEKESIQIQEQKLEPYQRQLDLLDRIRQDALQDVQDNGFLGMTQARWAEIANDIERARFGVDGYADALKARLLAIPGFSVDANGQIQVDSAMLQQAAVTPSPGGNPPTGDTANQTTTTATEKTETQKQIDELNRRIAITRWRVNNEKLTADQKQELMQLNIKRIKEAQRLGGPNAADMTSQIQPGTTKKITELAPGFAAGGYVARYMRMGGLLPYKAEGGTIFGSMGTDTVPAMLTPGEFVVRRHAVSNFGVDRLKAINNGTYKGDSMYNYNLSINVKSDANPDEIARSVMAQIKRIDSQRIRGNRF